MSAYTLQATFSRGEISPRLRSRADIDHWAMSLKQCRNFFVMRQGGLRKRMGTYFAAEVKDSTKATRVMPFVFSTEQAYIVEVGDQYMRFYANGGVIEDPPGTPIELSTSYLEAQLFDIQYAQSADISYLAHELHAPAQLTRLTATSFQLSTTLFTDQPTDWVANNWPSVVAFYNQRLAYGSTPQQPQELWLSKEGIITDHGTSVPLVADDAINVTILSGEVNAIQWLAEGRDLMIGTTGAARTLGPSDRGLPFSATNLTQKRHAERGAKKIMPVQVGTVLLYASRLGTKIHEYLYSFEADGYIAPELTVLSEHIFKKVIVEMAYAQDPESIIWMAMATGELAALTYDREQQIVGITLHDVGGIVESVATIPGDFEDEVWMVVRRTINGVSKRFIEYFELQWDEEIDTVEDAFFVDCGLTYDGAPTTTVSGLDHLEGETVTILADGAVIPPRVVNSSGVINLPSGIAASKIHIGLPYEATIRTLPLAVSMGDGSGLHRPKKVAQLIVDLLASSPVKAAGISKDDVLRDETISHYRDGADIMDQPVPLKTGPVELFLDTSWEDGGELQIRSDQPLPCVIRSISMNIESAP